MPPGAPPVAEQIMGSGLTVYFFVDSIEKATEKIEALGGKTVLPKKTQGTSGYFSNLVDIEGNRFGIYQLQDHMIL
jgi:predicted enzyme related to lactoylglutathione lyase